MAARKRTPTPGGQPAITLVRLQDQRVELDIEGLSPVIPHQWSEKAKRMMPGYVDPLTGNRPDTMEKKGDRTPRQEAEACVYRLEDGRPAIPATAFKAAMVSACRFFEKPTMTEAKLLFFVEGEGPDQLVAFEHEGDPVLREDLARNANGGADLRYRHSFFPWRATLRIRFVPSSISEGSVVALVDAAGRVGVGDWRPGAPKSATGTFGTWRVAEAGEAEAAEDDSARNG
jgi:hypothetical protein